MTLTEEGTGFKVTFQELKFTFLDLTFQLVGEGNNKRSVFHSVVHVSTLGITWFLISHSPCPCTLVMVPYFILEIHLTPHCEQPTSVMFSSKDWVYNRSLNTQFLFPRTLDLKNSYLSKDFFFFPKCKWIVTILPFAFCCLDSCKYPGFLTRFFNHPFPSVRFPKSLMYKFPFSRRQFLLGHTRNPNTCQLSLVSTGVGWAPHPLGPVSLEEEKTQR